MNLAEILCGFIFSVWFTLSVLNQFAESRLLSLNVVILRLLPRWSFFAPTPADFDTEIVVKCNNGRDSRWFSVCIIESQDWYSFVINRSSVYNKAIMDISSLLAIHRNVLKVEKL